MENVAELLAVVVVLAGKAVVFVALVYVGVRLALRHERRP